MNSTYVAIDKQSDFPLFDQRLLLGYKWKEEIFSENETVEAHQFYEMHCLLAHVEEVHGSLPSLTTTCQMAGKYLSTICKHGLSCSQKYKIQPMVAGKFVNQVNLTWALCCNVVHFDQLSKNIMA